MSFWGSRIASGVLSDAHGNRLGIVRCGGCREVELERGRLGSFRGECCYHQRHGPVHVKDDASIRARAKGRNAHAVAAALDQPDGEPLRHPCGVCEDESVRVPRAGGFGVVEQFDLRDGDIVYAPAGSSDRFIGNVFKAEENLLSCEGRQIDLFALPSGERVPCRKGRMRFGTGRSPRLAFLRGCATLRRRHRRA